MRLRSFTQDDSHIFCRKQHILDEAKNYISMLREVYARFDFHEVKVKLSTRPENRAGSDEVWDLAEKMLGEACAEMKLDYEISVGDGAFYGPKLEFTLVDALGRDWQCGTFQLDFVLPQRFGLSYQNDQGELVHSQSNDDDPVVMIHHAVLGSLERWIGVLLESCDGKLPVWLSPVQVVIATISEKSTDWAKDVQSQLRKVGMRVELDLDSEKITSKIKKHSIRKVPYILIIGEKEAENLEVNVRKLDGSRPVNMTVFQFIGEIG